VTVQSRIFFTYLYLDNTTGMTHIKTVTMYTELFVAHEDDRCCSR